MNWDSVIIAVLPLIVFGTLFFVFVTGRLSRKTLVHVVVAFKPAFPDSVEIRISHDENEIADLEREYRGKGYRVSRKSEVIKIRAPRPVTMGWSR